MYNKITLQKLKWLYIFKYFFQLIIAPLLLGGTILGAVFTVFWIRDGYDQACLSCLHDSINFLGIKNVNSAVAFILTGVVLNVLNILSIIPFIGLIEDLFTKNDVIEKEITFASVFPLIEISSYFGPHRFICDTFSRKDNSEVFVIDENKKYYRLLWNENYGSKAEFEKFEKAERLKIQYLRHSRIIVGVEVLE